MTVYLAIDPVAGIDLPDGRIHALDETTTALAAQGVDLSVYAGDRRAALDETDSNVWTNDCVPGWYYVDGAVQVNPPRTDTQRLQDGAWFIQNQLAAWADGLDSLRRGQPIAKVESGHDWLYYKKQAVYLVMTNQSSASDGGAAVVRSIDDRVGWARASAFGAAGVASPAQFYADPSEPNPPTFPITWRELASPFTAVTLTNRIRIYPAAGAPDFNTVDLAGGTWINSLLAA